MTVYIHYLVKTSKFFSVNLKMKSKSAKQSRLGQYHDQLLKYLPAISYLQVNLTNFSKYLYVIKIFPVGNLKNYSAKAVSKFLK